MLLVIAPLLFATYLASTLVLGYHHHGYDVVAGGLIRLTMAFFGYRMCFASIWDPRWNTVPLTRSRDDRTGDDEEGLRHKESQAVDEHNDGAIESRDPSPS